MLPTLRGVLVVLAPAPIFALATWWPSFEWLAVGLALIALGALALDWRLAVPLEHLEVSRHHDTKLSLAAANPIRLRVRNRARRALQIWVRDEPPHEFELDQAVLEAEVPPRKTWESVYHVRPLRRGNYRFGSVNLRWLGPFGLVKRQAAVGLGRTVKVYPNLLDIRRYDLLLRRNRLQEIGLRRARQFGEGTSFERLREYLPDDDFRRIDWKATARRHRPVAIEYQPERSQNLIVVLEAGRMMQTPVEGISKLDFAVNAALMLTYVATGKGDKVGLLSFADEITHFLKPRAGRSHFYRILERLYAIEPVPIEPNYRRALTYLAHVQRKRALIVIFTDFSGGLGVGSLVSHALMLTRRSLPLVVTISDPDVHRIARVSPHSSSEVYQRAAAMTLLQERNLVLERLQRRGVLTLDVPANELSAAVINRYLALKGRVRL